MKNEDCGLRNEELMEKDCRFGNSSKSEIANPKCFD
jgi:hypothetical protein